MLCVCVCLYWHSKRGQESIFLHSKWGHLTKRVENFSPRFVTRCTALTLSIYRYGGGMDVILSLYVPGMFRDVWKNVLTLNVLYTDLSSLWMLGQTHYTHVCIVCPHFECLNGGGGGGGCMSPRLYTKKIAMFFILYNLNVLSFYYTCLRQSLVSYKSFLFCLSAKEV